VCDFNHLTKTIKVKGTKMGKRTLQFTFSECVQVEQTGRRAMNNQVTGSTMLDARDDVRTIHACYMIGKNLLVH